MAWNAKDIIKTPGANVELLSTWRTQDQALISLWNEVRTRADMITEKLVINGPYSEDIGPNVFKRECEDEVMMRAKKVRIWTRIYDSSLLFRFSLHMPFQFTRRKALSMTLSR